MIEFIKYFLGFNKPEERKDDFSDFFQSASSKEKAKVIRQVLREANEEQREMVKKHKEKAFVG